MNHDGSGGVSSVTANLGSMVEKVPYNHLIMARKGQEGRSGLVGLCLSVLCVLLEYQVDDTTPPSEIAPSPLSRNGSDGLPASSSTTQHSNSFRYFLAKLVCPIPYHSIYDSDGWFYDGSAPNI